MFWKNRNKELKSLEKKLNKSDGYMLAITYRKNDKLKHNFFIKNFRTADVEPSFKELIKIYKKERDILTKDN